MMGMKLTIGAGAAAIPNQPHWKTATSAPNIAETDSRYPRVALIGTKIERKAKTSNTIDSPTTTDR